MKVKVDIFPVRAEICCDIMNREMEEDWEKLAQKCNGEEVGSGCGFGGRDISYEFKTYKGALKFKKLLKNYKPYELE